jgi:Tfp pilus assembly PilM family ATPase
MPVSIDVGSKYVKILEGNYTKKGTIAITQSIVEQTPEGLLENGYIKDVTALSMFLRNVVQTHGLGKKPCHVTAKSSDIAAREFVVPVMSGGKLKKVVANEISAI